MKKVLFLFMIIPTVSFSQLPVVEIKKDTSTLIIGEPQPQESLNVEIEEFNVDGKKVIVKRYEKLTVIFKEEEDEN